jgi:putative nucleotidyltransferase with HDIG domain
MSSLPLQARLYVGFVIAAGALALFALGPRASFEHPLLFVALLVLSAVTAAFKINLPVVKSGSTLSVSYAIDFTALLMLGANETMLVAAASAWSPCTFRVKERTPVYRTLFSMASLALTVQATGIVFAQLGGIPGRLGNTAFEIAVPLIGAALTYFVVNTALVAAAVGLTTAQPVWRVWHQNFLWSSPSFFVGAAAAAAAQWALLSSGLWWLTLLLIAPIFLTYKSYQIYLGRMDEERRHAQEIADLNLATIEALALAIDAKDQTAQSHIHRVQTHAAGLARAFGMSDAEIQGVKTAALLHDIGKLAVPEHILSKPGPLTHEEFQKIRIHPQVGAEIISAVPFPYPVAPLILSHHERWDGKGYPQGLKGEDIPLGARILNVVDHFDALTSDRPYHRAMSRQAALALIQQEAGRALDPAVVQMFVNMLDQLTADADRSEGMPERRLSLKTRLDRARTIGAGVEAGTGTTVSFKP